MSGFRFRDGRGQLVRLRLRVRAEFRQVRRLTQIIYKGCLKRRLAALLRQYARLTHGEYASRMHEGYPVAAFRLVHEVRGNEYRHALFARQVDQVLPELVARNRVDAGSRLVEDEDFRIVDYGDRELKPLANTERKPVRPGGFHFFQVEAFQHFPHAVFARLFRDVKEFRMQFQVLANRQFLIERKALRHVADAPPRRHIPCVEFLAEKPGGAFAHRQKASQHLHRRRLAAAVRAQKAEDLAAFDAEVHPVDRNEVAEAAGQVGRLDRGIAVMRHAGRYVHRLVACSLFLRQQPDEGGFERFLSCRLANIRRRSRGKHPAVIHCGQPVEAFRLLHIGGSHEHAHMRAAGADRVDEFPELPPRQRIDAGRRLVEDQQVRVMDESAAEPELLFHAAGQGAHGAIGKGRKSRRRQQFLDAFPALCGAEAEKPSEEIEVLFDAQRRIEVLAEALGHIGDARMAEAPVSGRLHVAVEYRDFARLDTPHAGKDREQRRLADAVRPDQPGHAAGGYVERHVIEGKGLAIAMRQAAKSCGGPGALVVRAAVHSAAPLASPVSPSRGAPSRGWAIGGSFTASSSGHSVPASVRT